MEHYTALIRAVASDSIAVMYTEDGDDGKVVVDSASTVSDDVEVFGTTAYQWGSFSQVARVQDQPPAKFWRPVRSALAPDSGRAVEAHSPADAAGAPICPVTHRRDRESSGRGSDRLQDA